MKYKIKKGKHFAQFTINRLFPFTCSKISGSVMFDSNCLVKESIPGWNKLTGISGTKIHKDSGRLVWRSKGNQISIAGYVYNNGERKEIEITTIPVNMWFSYKIEHYKDVWRLSVGGKVVIMSGNLGFFKFRCYPYFGGQSTAPVDMVIELGR